MLDTATNGAGTKHIFAFDSFSFSLRKDQNGVGNHVVTCLKEIKTRLDYFQRNPQERSVGIFFFPA